jgi:hypothetical protein
LVNNFMLFSIATCPIQEALCKRESLAQDINSPCIFGNQ